MGKPELRHGVESVFCFAPETASRTTRRPAKLQRAHQYRPSKLRAKRRAAESRRTDSGRPNSGEIRVNGVGPADGDTGGEDTAGHRIEKGEAGRVPVRGVTSA